MNLPAPVLSTIRTFTGRDVDDLRFQQLAKDVYRVSCLRRRLDLKLRIQNVSNNRPPLLENEFRGLEFLSGAGLTSLITPQPVHLELHTEPAFTLTSYIAGTPILTNERTLEHTTIERICEAITAVHVTCPHNWGRFVDKIGAPRALTWHEEFRMHFERDVTTIFSASNDLDIPSVTEAFGIVRNSLDRIHCTTKTFLHGDIHPGNILDNGHNLAFVDYQHCLVGDPLFDVAELRVRFRKYVDDVDVLTSEILLSFGATGNATSFWIYVLAALLNEISFSIRSGDMQRAIRYSALLKEELARCRCHL